MSSEDVPVAIYPVAGGRTSASTQQALRNEAILHQLSRSFEGNARCFERMFVADVEDHACKSSEQDKCRCTHEASHANIDSIIELLYDGISILAVLRYF